MRLQKFIAFGSPAGFIYFNFYFISEEMIKPWYTSLFDYEGQNGERVYFNQQFFWALGMPCILLSYFPFSYATRSF